jgi:predicted RNA binding protein YcfA (HicA-like mRNA interferase family)
VAKADKRLQKAKNNPKGWRFEELKSLYEAFGFEVRSGKGSHHVAVHPKLKPRPTVIKHSGELPPEYVKQAVELIEELLQLEGEEDNESE